MSAKPNFFTGGPKTDTLKQRLSQTVSQNGVQIFFQKQFLRDTLAAAGSGELEIEQVLLMTQVTGFRELLENNLPTQQQDLNRYVKNAVDETGLRQDVVLDLTADIALAAKIAIPYRQLKKKRGKKGNPSKTPEKEAFVIPAKLYREELEDFENALGKDISWDKTIPPLNFSKLTPLAEVGIPRAKALLGFSMARCSPDGEKTAGLTLLQEAAAEGDEAASALLGDYYFQLGDRGSQRKAYQYYTGLGSLALNRQRQANLEALLQAKRNNRAGVFSCALLCLILSITALLNPAAGLFPAAPAWTALFLAANTALLALMIWRFHVEPLDGLAIFPTALFSLWALYWAVRILF